MSEDIVVHPLMPGRAARCEDLVLRETSSGRVLLRMEIVEKDDLPRGGVKASLAYQRKKRSEAWDEYQGPKEVKHLGNTKAGTELVIALKTEEVLKLRDFLNSAQAIKDQFEVPRQPMRFIGVSQVFDSLSGPITRFAVRRDKKASDDLLALLKALLQRDDINEIATAVSALEEGEFGDLATSVATTALDRLLVEWDALPRKASEKQWQDLLKKHPFALQQVFHTPAILHGHDVPMGGRTWKRGDKKADFLLLARSTRRPFVVEIKRRSTKLLGDEYRTHIFSMSDDFSGAVNQTLHYRDQLRAALEDLDEEDEVLHSSLPMCALIIGSDEELDDDDKIASFESARSRRDLAIMTFDELRSRLQAIKDALLSTPGLD